MVPLPQSFRRLIKELSAIPSLGLRQATRIAFYLASAEGRELAEALGYALYGLKDIKTCARCYFLFEPAKISHGETSAGKGEGSSSQVAGKEIWEGKLCEICANPARKQNEIMLVEKETDLMSLEATGKFKGRYLVLGDLPKTGALEPWQKERLANLKKFIKKELGGEAEEIILGFNPTSLGDFHASLLTKELEGAARKISRLGRGLPTGGEVGFADDETLGSAIANRN